MKQLFLVAIFLAYHVSGIAQAPEDKSYGWLDSTLFAGASVSFHALQLATDSTFLSLDARRRLVPASIVKLIPVGLLLQQSSASQQIPTLLMPAADSYRSGDTLMGDLWLMGNGDPSLASERMPGSMTAQAVAESIRQVLSAKGIHVVKGKVVGIPLVFPHARIPGAYLAMDAGNYYAAPSCGLNWADNTYRLSLQTDEPGSRAEIGVVQPAIPGLEHSSFVAAKGNKDEAYIMGMPGVYKRQVIGTMPAYATNFTIKGAVPDPALFAAQQLQRLLEERGIVFSEAAAVDRTRTIDTTVKAWWTHQSPTMRDLLRHTLERSDNLFAETWVRLLFPAALDPWYMLGDAYRDFTGASFTGVIADGSGLSRSNGLSAMDFTTFLRAMYQSAAFPDFLYSLAEAGKEGTMRLVQLPATFKGQIWGKSGYMTGVRSYAGYYRSVTGNWYAFALIVNNYNGSAAAMRQALTRVMASFDQWP